MKHTLNLLGVLLFLACPAMQFAQSGHSPARTGRALEGHDLSINAISRLQAEVPWLQGEDLTVSLKELDFDTTDIDFRGRYLPAALASGQRSTHATFMATMIGGAGNSFYKGRGVAPACRLTSSDFRILLPDPAAAYQDLGISVQNHSYGVEIENFYGMDAAAYDASVVQMPHLLHVFSAGNKGTEASGQGRYAGIRGYANLSGSFKMAKNVLTVGATNQLGEIESRSSAGPAYDGRLKPELLAFGQDGSSGAAALVSGTALLLQQAWRELNGELPTAAMVKALLINSADDAGAPGIDYRAGYGSLNAWRAFSQLQAGQVFSGSLTDSGQARIRVELPPNLAEFKVTLVWTDPAAAPDAPKALVNDLDLRLTHLSSGQQWLPWVLDPTPDSSALAAPPLRRRDSLNNVEQISLLTPAAGMYEISVSAFELATLSQSFHLVWGGEEKEQFEWTFPADNEVLEAGQELALRWQSTLADSSGSLEVSFDGGQSWQPAKTNVDLQAEQVFWQVPDTLAHIQLRLKTPGATYPTGILRVSPATELQVGFNCPDSVQLFWRAHPQAVGYRLYQLGNPYMETMATLADTVVVLEKSTLLSRHFAVAPLMDGGEEGLRGLSRQYEQQGVGCYFSSLLASALPDGQGRLRLSLGSVHEVQAIVFEQWRGSRFEQLQRIEQPTQLSYEVPLSILRNGINRFRARLELSNGQHLYSEEAELSYAAPGQFWAFPNPVRSGRLLQILSHEPLAGARLQLLDTSGRRWWQQALDGVVDEVALPALPAGLYILKVVRGQERLHQQKLVVYP